MPEIRQKIISCPSGHYYDANKYSACPYCNQNQGGFSQTTDPFSGVSPDYNGGMTPTEIPGESGFGGTVYPGAETVAGGGFIDTMPPDIGGGYNDNMQPTGIVIGGAGKDVPDQNQLPAVGWVVVVEGPNRGTDYRIHTGYNYIGRRTGDIMIKGDDTISGERDSSITYVYQTKKFYIAHEQGKNVLLVNDIPVMGGGTELHNYDIITIGTTKLIFLGLCGDKFSWEDKERSNG